MGGFQYIVVGLIGIVLGSYLTYRVNQATNQQLLASIKAELEQYVIKSKTSRLTPEEQKRAEILQAQIDILTKK